MSKDLKFRLFDKLRAFSLLEMLVAIAVLGIIVVLASSLTGAIQNVWKRTSAQTEQFRSARQGLETISSRLSQATLNPYWVVQTNSSGTPVRYERQSDLRFLSSNTNPTPSAQPGSALFFQAPTGFYTNSANTLNAALNTWGYFVEYDSDASYNNYRPAFLAAGAAKYRFRLVEFLDPSDGLRIFQDTSGRPSYTGTAWFSTPLGTPGTRRVLAENIVALIALPRLSSVEDASGTALAPGYTYDSTSSNSVAKLNPKHQLPPIVDIAVVAIAESSAGRITWGSSPPNFGASSLFTNPANMDADLETLRKNIEAQGLSAQVFRTSVPIAAARWSTEQSN